jgi:membrane protease YdiL (CAAX protease family)
MSDYPSNSPESNDASIPELRWKPLRPIHGWFGLIFTLAFTFIISMLVMMVLHPSAETLVHEDGTLVSTPVSKWETYLQNSLLPLLLVIGVCLYCIVTLLRPIRRVVLLNPVPFSPYLWVLLGTLSLGILGDEFVFLINQVVPTSDLTTYLQFAMFTSESTIWDYLMVILILAVFPGFAEEVFFRGFLLNSFRQGYGIGVSILATAILFAAVHMNLTQAVPAFLVGIYLGWMSHRYHSILPGIVAHTLNNAIFLILLNSGMVDQIFSEGYPIWILLLAGMGIVISLWAVLRMNTYLRRT